MRKRARELSRVAALNSVARTQHERLARRVGNGVVEFGIIDPFVPPTWRRGGRPHICM